MSERIYTDTKDHADVATAAADVLTRAGQAAGDPFAVVVFEREEASDDLTPAREYLQPVLFTGADAEEINAAIADFMGPDGDGDITTEAWLEAYRGIEPGDIDFDNN
jgi:hypothetical protein